MDIFDSRYFSINKRFLTILGIWPYDSRRKYFIRTFCLTLMLILPVPQFIGIKMNNSDLDRAIENTIYAMIIYTALIKAFMLALSQKQLRKMFDGIAYHTQMISDETEKQILHKYAEMGRHLTVLYVVYFSVGLSFFCLGPLIPWILNKIDPQSPQRPYLYILDGEFLFEDNDAHYFVIYFWDVLSVFMVALVLIGSDMTYTVCVEHFVGLFHIVRYRIQMHGRLVSESSSSTKDPDYDRIVATIKMHQDILEFIETLRVSYSAILFVVLGITVILFPVSCILMIANLHDPVQMLRFFVPFCSSTIHLFTLCWPGQKLIDSSTGLFEDAEWYEGSVKSKKLLIIFMLRCLTPSTISAGGLITINYETFVSIMKTAISYVTVISSFR